MQLGRNKKIWSVVVLRLTILALKKAHQHNAVGRSNVIGSIRLLAVCFTWCFSALLILAVVSQESAIEDFDCARGAVKRRLSGYAQGVSSILLWLRPA